MLELLKELASLIGDLKEIHAADTTPNKPSLWVVLYELIVTYKEYVQALNAQNASNG